MHQGGFSLLRGYLDGDSCLAWCGLFASSGCSLAWGIVMMISYIWGRGALSLGGVQMEAGRREEDYLCEGREAAWFRTMLYAQGLG